MLAKKKPGKKEQFISEGRKRINHEQTKGYFREPNVRIDGVRTSISTGQTVYAPDRFPETTTTESLKQTINPDKSAMINTLNHDNMNNHSNPLVESISFMNSVFYA